MAERWRILAPDQRGHGATTLAADPAGRRDWWDLAADLLGLAEVDGLAGAVVAGHSMGATAGLLAASRSPGIARRLLLIDPVILPRGRRITPATPESDNPLARAASRRRRDFPDRAAARAAYRDRGAFAGWNTEILEDYVEAGFAKSAAGVSLACAPEWEASNYRAHGHDAWAALAAYSGPVEILRAGVGSTCAIDEGAAGAFRNLTVRTIPQATHFLPMLRPDPVRAALAQALALD